MNYKIICVKVGSTCADAPEHHFITTEDDWLFMKLFIGNFNETMNEDYDYDLCEYLCDVASNITNKQLEKFNYTNYARMRNKIIKYHEKE